MKKIILTVAVVFAFGIVNAQETKFGVKGGLNVTSITNSDGASSLIGFHAGFFAAIKITEKFAIQPELLYSMQGAKDSDISLHLDYITIPIMAKFYIAKDFSLEAGPQIGFLIAAKAKSGGESASVKELFKSTDFGVNFGAGYDVGENLILGLRYNLGLSQLLKDIDPGQSASKNTVFSVSVGYKF